MGGIVGCIAAGFSAFLLETLLRAYIEVYGTSAHNLMGILYLPLFPLTLVAGFGFLYYSWMALSLLVQEAV
jgi:hypothetical protein